MILFWMGNYTPLCVSASLIRFSVLPGLSSDLCELSFWLPVQIVN